MTSLLNDFEPSSAAAAAPGPKHLIPALVTASAAPLTSGASGPTTTRSTPSRRAAATTPPRSSAATSSSRASAAMPALPGAQRSSGRWGERASACTSACSRLPEPRTRTRGCSKGTAEPPPTALARSAGAAGGGSPGPYRSDDANEVVDRDGAQRLVLSGAARTQLERHPRDGL